MKSLNPSTNIQAYFLNGRSALGFAIKQFDLDQSNIILVPNIICSDVVQVFETLDICIIYYPVSYNFCIDWSKLLDLIQSHKPVAILAVNYFDQSTELTKIKNICDKFNLIMIEDNCHGLEIGSAQYKSSQIGDIMISSPRKILKTPYGGYLSIKSPSLIYHDFPIQIRQRVLVPKISLLLKYLILKYSPYLTRELRKRKQILKYQDKLKANLFFYNHGQLDIFSYFALKFCSKNKVIEIRKKNWQLWEKYLSNWGAVPIFRDIKYRSCPWAFPFVLPKRQSTKLLELTKNRGIPIFHWPDIVPHSSPKDHKKIYCIDLLHEPDWYL